MMESPTFNEASLRQPTEARTRIRREVFSRRDALTQCPSHMRPVFEDLFARIDKLDLAIQSYEIAHGKREALREDLASNFTQDDIDAAAQTAAKWTQYKYLKQRHLIVELRRE